MHRIARTLGRPIRIFAALLLLTGTLVLAQSAPPNAAIAQSDLRFTRPVRTWEFMPAVGRKAALLGHESGTVEAWVYPMKIFREFSLVFHVGDRAIPAASLVRTIDVRPEAVTLIYADDTFSVKETFFVPRDESGAVIELEVTAYQPIDIEARFRRDFQLMWPAAIGGTYGSWDNQLHVFHFGEEQKKWFATVGSPTATNATNDYETNYYAEEFDSFHLGPIAKGTERRVIVVAGSMTSRDEADATYKRLAAEHDSLRQLAASQYADYLEQTTSLSLPDTDLQRAYDWGRVSVLQGVVTNPFLGTGLVAGYRTSGTGSRPGYAWFFGRDSEWTTFALNSEGDFETTRSALDFLSKYQRQDGKVPHEISQTAKQVPWFTDFPYAFASADATPLYIIAVRDYYQQSGDKEFVTSHWDNVWRAYQFLRSTWDRNGLAQNIGIGHGWVEGGPLLPVKSEFYQSGLSTEALDALAMLARAAGKDDVATEAEQLFNQHRAKLNDAFWNPDGHYFAFAIDQQDRRVDTPTVLTTVPMWFGITEPNKTDATITQLADADHSADWGMRILSMRNPLFDPSGYHFGSVWPLFTGWASVAEYRYHRPLPAYENLRANALLALDGSAGHPTEVLSGAVFEQLSTSSPHQIWSAAMVVSPMLRGLLGINANTSINRLTIASHLPGDWTWWKARNVRIGSATVDLAYNDAGNTISLEVNSRSAKQTTLEFSPSISPHARIKGVEINGRKAKFDVQKNATDQHVVVNMPLTSATNSIRIAVQDDFALILKPGLPPLGETSRNLKVVKESWTSTNDAVTYELAGLGGMTYDIDTRGSSITSVEGAEIVHADRGTLLRVRFPGRPDYQHQKITVHLGRTRK